MLSQCRKGKPEAHAVTLRQAVGDDKRIKSMEAAVCLMVITAQAQVWRLTGTTTTLKTLSPKHILPRPAITGFDLLLRSVHCNQAYAVYITDWVGALEQLSTPQSSIPLRRHSTENPIQYTSNCQRIPALREHTTVHPA